MILTIILQTTETPFWDCLDIKWIIGTVIGLIFAGTTTYIAVKKYRREVKNESKSNVGSTMVRYYSKREKANEEIAEKLKLAKKEIFIAGIGLTTLGNILVRPEIISHIVKLINMDESTFKIRIIGCDSLENAKRPFQDPVKVTTRIKTGKGHLNTFINKLKDQLTGQKYAEIIEYVEINNYPKNIIPRHLIIEIDDIIYVGSYLDNTLGKESYTLKLVNEDSKDNHNSGLYNLFAREVKLLKENCTTNYNLN